MTNPDRMVQIAGEMFRVEEDGAWIALDLAHERIHLGHVYTASVYNASLANNGTASLHIVAGTVEPHFTYQVAAGGNCVLSVYEGGTLAGTAALAAYNRNRDVATAHKATLVQGGTITGGTALITAYVPGGSGGTKQGGASRADNEFVGQAGQVYSIALVNISGGAAAVSLGVDFYEVSE